MAAPRKTESKVRSTTGENPSEGETQVKANETTLARATFEAYELEVSSKLDGAGYALARRLFAPSTMDDGIAQVSDGKAQVPRMESRRQLLAESLDGLFPSWTRNSNQA